MYSFLCVVKSTIFNSIHIIFAAVVKAFCDILVDITVIYSCLNERGKKKKKYVKLILRLFKGIR